MRYVKFEDTVVAARKPQTRGPGTIPRTVLRCLHCDWSAEADFDQAGIVGLKHQAVHDDGEAARQERQERILEAYPQPPYF